MVRARATRRSEAADRSLADVSRRLLRPALQSLEAGHGGEREGAVARVDLQDHVLAVGASGRSAGPTPPPAAGRGGGGGGATPGGPVIKAIPLMVNGVLYLSAPNHVTRSTRAPARALALRVAGAQRDRQSRRRHVWELAVRRHARQQRRLARRRTGKERWNRKLVGPTAVELFDLGAGRRAEPRHGRCRRRGGGSQSFVESLDPETGASQWKWYTTPRRGEPGIETWPNAETSRSKAPAAPWQPPTYDPELNLLYVPHRPADAHLQRQEPRRGQPLHLLGRRAQPRHRQDGVVLPVLAARHARLGRDADADPDRRHINGQPRKLLAQANRNGYYFLLDRATGKSLVVRAVCRVQFLFRRATIGSLVPNPAKEGCAGRHARVSGFRRRGELSVAVVQPRHRPVLRQCDRRGQHLLPAADRPIRPARPRVGVAPRDCSARG